MKKLIKNSMSHWLKPILIFAFLFSFSCAQKMPAQIINHSKDQYSRSRYIKEIQKNNSAAISKIEISKIEKEAEPKKPSNSREITIAAGETLYSISRKHQFLVRDLIAHNNLNPPYIIKPGDKLLIPSTTYHEVSGGDTLYSISRIYGMKVSDLVALNNLSEPYSIKLGERIKISQNNDNPAQTAKESEVKKIPAEVTKEPETSLGIVDKFNKFSWPVAGKIISDFGPKSGGLYNDGVKIKAAEGADVKASKDGVVAYVGNELKGYGNLIIIKHDSGWITAYAHLKNSNVKRGDKVAKGQKIGTVGATGNVDSPQLYFGLRKGRDAVNPEAYLK